MARNYSIFFFQKAADVVKSQLENDQVLRALDQNSDSDENDRLFGWDMVFQAGVKYVLKVRI